MNIRDSRNTFVSLFLVLVLVLMFMPLVSTFSDLLTRAVMSLDAYKIIEEKVIPWEVRMVGVILYPLGFKPTVVGQYLSLPGSKTLLIEIAWNCIGWQSLIFFLLTAWVGLQGSHYTLASKVKAWTIGFFGTFLLNLFRITAITLIAYFFGQNMAMVFHDYGSTLAIIAWLFFYWWFTYKFVLLERS